MSNGSHRESLFSGALAGVLSRTATAPLERLKILRQVHNLDHEGMAQTFRRLYRTEGMRGLYKGNGVNAVRIAPYNAIQLASFQKYKDMLGIHDKPTSKVILASSASAMTSIMVCYPLDVIRSTLTIQGENGSVKQRAYKGIVDTAKDIYKKRGFRGLYGGLNASLLGITPYVGMNLAMFDVLKHHFQPPVDHKYFDAFNFGLGAGSALFSVVTTYPFEVTRRRLQLSGILNRSEYSGIVDCVKKTWAKGPTSFYTGLVPCCLRVIPAMSIVMLVNERMRSLTNK
jgi:solute carrier family 25 phosphate transporter 23/24/25/41